VLLDHIAQALPHTGQIELHERLAPILDGVDE